MTAAAPQTIPLFYRCPGSMAECRDFFQEPTSGIRRSSPAAENFSTSRLAESVEEVGAHSLELTLGLGPPAGSSSSSQVKPSSVYSCLPPETGLSISTSNLLQTPPLQFDALESPQNCIGQPEGTALTKQRSGNFTFGGAHLHPIFGGQADVGVGAKSGTPSRDQVWMNLQKNGTVFGQNLDQQREISSIWSRRSASMHLVISGNDGGDAENRLIRRSSSIGVAGSSENYHIRRSSSSGIPPHTVLRHLSSIDSSLNEKSLSIQGQDKEAFDGLRKRKEMQAQRTQEARKRRKTLIEEKQLKKSKHGSSLQRLGSRQSISPNDMVCLTGMYSDEDGVRTPQSHGTLDVPQQESEGKVRESVSMIQNSGTEEAEQETSLQCVKDDKISMFTSSIGEVESPSHSMHSKEGVVMHGYDSTCSGQLKDGALNRLSRNLSSYGSMVTGECDQLTSGGHCVSGSKFQTTDNECKHGSSHNLHAPPVVAAHWGARMTEEEGKSSETGCVDNSSLQNSVNLPQCVAKKGEVGAVLSSALSTAATTSAFPFLAVPYACTVEPSTHTSIPMQPVFPFPFLVEYPVSSHSEKGSSPMQVTCSGATGMTAETSLPVAAMSKSSSASKDNVGANFEGKGCSSEKPVSIPLLRTSSNIKLLKEEGQSLGVPPDMQAAFPTSQLKSFSSVVSDACNSKLERQQSMPLGCRFPPQISSARNESTLFPVVHERPILTQNGVDVRQEAPTLRVDTKAEVTPVERVRQDEASMESQLVSLQSGVDASYAPSRSIERQKSGSLSDLPWVTTTGKGPRGKTISGVMYIVNGRHVRLVCSCHGKHMSPAEFVEHSGSSDLSNPERHIVVSPFPTFNHQ